MPLPPEGGVPGQYPDAPHLNRQRAAQIRNLRYNAVSPSLETQAGTLNSAMNCLMAGDSTLFFL